MVVTNKHVPSFSTYFANSKQRNADFSRRCHKRTKVIATLGPACDDDAIMRAMFQAGMNVARFNMSHNTRDDHQRRLDQVRRLSMELQRPVAALVDLQGPKIRIGDLEDDGPHHWHTDDIVILTTEPLDKGTAARMSCSYKHLHRDVRPGHHVLVDDGKMRLVVERIEDHDVFCRVLNGGPVKSRKGINLPDTSVSAPSLSKKDVEDLRWAVEGKDGAAARGLVIRERPVQRVYKGQTWTGMPERPNDTVYASDPNYPVFGVGAAKEYANYLKSQYVVYWGSDDITDCFFDYGIDTARTPTTSFDPAAPTDPTKSIPGGLVCFEDDVLDRREGTFTQYFFLSKDGNYTSTGTVASGSDYVGGKAKHEDWWHDNYRVNTLTLNMERVLDFIKNYDGKDPEDPSKDDPNWPSAAPDPTALEDHFSGQIYVARTRRSPGMQPDRPRWIVDHFVNWRNGDGINFLDYDSRPIGDGDGTVQSDEVLDWRTFGGPDAVFHSAVRLWNASDLDSGAEFVDDMGTPLDTTDDYYAKQGLTVVTPNLLYVWGDYNTTMYNDSTADQDTTAPGLQYLAKDYDRSTYPNDPSDSDPWRLPAAALMCDRVVLLSNEWQDEAQQWNVEPNASSAVTLNASLLLGVTPTIQQPDGNCPESGGVHNAVLYLEDQDAYNFRGSLVMMNRRLYGNSVNGAGNPTCTLRQSLYDAPNRFVNMNTDLFTARGQPPLTPFSVTIVRTANYIAEQN
ncbi:MAG: pyruvate kinase [Planctomycetota bacterium]